MAARFKSPVLASALRRAGDWWNERSERERLLVGGMLATALVALLVVTVIAPLRAMRSDALADIRNASLLEAQLRAGRPGSAGRIRRGSAQAIVTESAAAAKLAVQSVTAEGGDTRVVLSDAPFEQVLQWVADIERTSRLRVIEANIAHKGAPGLVGASVLLGG